MKSQAPVGQHVAKVMVGHSHRAELGELACPLWKPCHHHLRWPLSPSPTWREHLALILTVDQIKVVLYIDHHASVTASAI